MVLWSFPSNAATAWMISIALWLHECKFKISSIQGLNLRLTEMNAFRNHLERQRPPKYIFFDLVKTKWDWMQSCIKPVISQFGASRRPPAFIGREKKKFNFSSFKFSFILKSFVLSYISKIFQHPKYWHTNPIRIMSIVAEYNTRSLVLFDLKCFLREISFPFQYCVQSRILVFVGWNDLILMFLWSLFSKSIEIFRKYERSGRFA